MATADEKLDRLLEGQATMQERVGNLCKSVEKSELENKSQHGEFFGRIGRIETRLSIMERVDDPDAVAEASYRKVMLDFLKIAIPIGATVLIALKLLGKL